LNFDEYNDSDCEINCEYIPDFINIPDEDYYNSSNKININDKLI